MKKLLVLLTVLAMLFCFSVPVMAGQTFGPPGYYEKVNGANAGRIKYFRNGHPGPQSEWRLVEPYNPCGGACDDVAALAENGIVIVNPTLVEDVHEMGWGYAGGKNLELTAKAFATGKDQQIWFFKIPGFAFADVDLDLFMKVFTKVWSTGVVYDGGLSLTKVKSLGLMTFDASAIATGNDGCPQFAEVGLSGIMTTTAAGYALSYGGGATAQTWGQGTTAVRLTAYDSDFDKHGWFIFPPVAHAGIEGLVMVKQSAFFMAYTSPDGMTTRTFGIVTGGSAMGFGDVDILGIRAKGEVSQYSVAQDGQGAFAYGYSHAQFKGAQGDVFNGRCGSFANVGGVATVSGYNNITITDSMISITSQHSAYATTGNSGSSFQVAR